MSQDVVDGVAPSAEQREVYGALLLGDPPANGWWLAWCPRCDGDQSPRRATAEVNFGTGRFKCTNLPSCHEGRQSVPMSTALAWVRGYGSVQEMRDARKAEKAEKAAQKQAERTKRENAKAEEKQRQIVERERLRAERRARRSDKFAEASEQVAQLTAAHPDVDRRLLPSKAQMAMWSTWVKTDKPPTEQVSTEGWWEGWCPLHDKEHKGKPSALFNFRYGAYKCLKDQPCHSPKKGMTLVNLARAIEPARG